MTLNVKSKNAVGVSLIVFCVIVAIATLVSLEPISQHSSYHQFSDSRTLWLMPNFWNVLSNIPFLLIGSWGLIQLRVTNHLRIAPENQQAYYFFCAGVLLVFAGSSYYHFDPSNESLVWDRLPMTIGFMSLISIIISEFVSARLGRLMLIPLLVFGSFSVFYWWLTETMGRGDLRLYLMVQFLPMLIAPVIMLVYRSRFTHTSGYWLLLLAYAAAKMLELHDSQVYSLSGGVVSGHTLKHVVAATGVYVLLRSYKRRTVNQKWI